MAVVLLLDNTVLEIERNKLPEKLQDKVFKQKVYSWTFRDEEESK
jgi:hypothetical protein